MARTLFVTDLDGTLLGADSSLSERTVQILNEALSRGALISVATARTPATVSYLLKDVDFRIPLVVMTGGALWDMKSGRYSEVQYFRPQQVEAVVEAYRRAGAGAFLYTLPPSHDGRDVFKIYHFGEFLDVEREFMEERLTSPYKRFDVPPTGESALPREIENAVLFFGMQPDEVARHAYAGISEIEDVNPMIYHDWHGDRIAEIEAFPAGSTKAKAIRRLARKVGAERIVVYGDNVNDLSMMAIADHSVAVGNAVDMVKEAADEVIGLNTEDAVARHIIQQLEAQDGK